MAGIISETDWLETPLGKHVLERERALYDSTVVDLFGFNAVQIGMQGADLLSQCRIPSRWQAGRSYGSLRCDAEQLSLANASVDLLLLPHVLEFAEHPHEVLREVERVLVPEGHVVISGFNPYSLWGVRHRMLARHGYPWNGKFISLMRLKDWLALLGLEVVGGRMACYAPPLRSGKWLNRLRCLDRAGDRWWPMMGGVYFLVARKRVIGMRLIRPQWKKRQLARALVPRARPTQKEFQKAKVVPDGQ